MEFRTMSLPDTSLYLRFMEELLGLVQKHALTYRHFVMLTIWNMTRLLSGRVPVGLRWPTDITDGEAGLEPIAEVFAGGNIRHLMWAGGDPRMAQVGILDELTGVWLCLRSVELSDTPCWYRPSEDLCYLLSATTLSGVYAEDIQLPYQAFWLEIPKGLLRTQTRRGWHDVRCIGVSTGTLETRSHTDMLERQGEYVGKDLSSVRGKRLVMVLIQEPLPTDTGLDDISFDSSSFPLTDGEALDVLLQKEHDLLRPTDGGQFRAEVFGKEVNFEEMRLVLFNLVMGFVLYLRERNAQVTAVPPVKKAKGKDRRGLAEMKRFISARTWLVGTRIRLNPIIRQAVREGGGSISHHHKTVVPGHSQRYRLGPRTDWHYEFRRKEPYVRGGDGPILGHSYESPPPSTT